MKRLFLLLGMIMLCLVAWGKHRSTKRPIDMMMLSFRDPLSLDSNTNVLLYAPISDSDSIRALGYRVICSTEEFFFPVRQDADSVMRWVAPMVEATSEPFRFTEADIAEFERYLQEEVMADEYYAQHWVNPYTPDQLLAFARQLPLVPVEKIIPVIEKIKGGHPRGEFSLKIFFADETAITIGPAFPYDPTPWLILKDDSAYYLSPEAAHTFLRRINLYDCYFGWDMNTLLLDLTRSLCRDAHASE